MKCLRLLQLYVVGGNCWTLVYYLGPSCQGEELTSQTLTAPSQTCIDTSVTNADSVELVSDSNPNYSLTFYQGSGCSGQPLGFTSDAGCVPFSTDGFGSIETQDPT